MKLKHILLSMLFLIALFPNVASASAQASAPAVPMTQEELVAYEKANFESKSVAELVVSFFHTTGLDAIINPVEGMKNVHGQEVSTFAQSWGRVIMFLIIFVLLLPSFVSFKFFGKLLA